MSAKTIRNALGVLQEDPDNEKAWGDLATSLSEPGMSTDELGKLLEAARLAHEMRREFDAVAGLLDIEVELAKGTELEVELVAEQARVYDEEILDDAKALASLRRLLALKGGADPRTEEAIEKSDAKRGRWLDIVKKFVEEAKGTNEPAFKSSLFVSGAEVAYRYGLPALSADKKGNKKKIESLEKEIVGGLKKALEFDPKNRRAAMLLERVYRQKQEFAALADVLERLANEVPQKEEKAAAWLRLARVAKKHLEDLPRAMRAYEQVIDLQPGHPEATSQLVDWFTDQEDWDHLVAVYEEQLTAGGARLAQDPGVLMQAAMVHWKKRGRADAAEPYFERLRRIEPAHPLMISFFRDRTKETNDQARFAQVLSEAQRAMPEGPEKTKVVAELATLAEEGANAAKAIDQWRALLRQDPNNASARDALRRLYRQTGGFNALADLLRSDLEKTAPDDAAARLPVLREIAGIYRDHIKSDSALVTVLSQLVALDPQDKDAVRELSRVYAALGRWRDLLTTQTRLAELETESDVRAEILRDVARRWLEQFSNVQNAIEAYEKLLEVVPGDEEATSKLKELYVKRRAYKPLYDLLEKEASRMSAGEPRRQAWMEMARVASERLDRGGDAVALFKKVIAEEPGNAAALDALEKQAEREKDFATVAEVLERRAELASDAQTKLGILLKLGTIYTDRLHDHAGAMRTYGYVLELSPNHAKALRVLRESYLAAGELDKLTDLYGQSEDWEGLAEVLSSAADRASDPEQKVELSYRAADVFAGRLKAPERAHRAYERVLSVRPEDGRAASSLVPLYEQEQKWQRLPALYEVLLKHADSDDERLALLGKLAQVTGQHLGDRVASFGHAKKAYEIDPDRQGALEAFELATRASGQWELFVGTLASRLEEVKGAGQRSTGGRKGRTEALATRKRSLRAKMAEVYATQLGRIEDAAAVFKELVEDDAEDEESALALDRILRSADRRDDLRWLFDLRVERANTSQKIQLLLEWASLEEDVFASAEQAVAIYKRLLEIVPQHGVALRALARLLRTSGDAEGAAAALEKDRDQREGVERAQREIELARLYMGPLNRPSDALAAAKRALDLGGPPAAEGRAAVEVVEELLQIADTRARAAVLLESIYDATGNAARQAEVLEVMIATAAAKKDRIALYNRVADVHEQKAKNANVAFEVIARAAREFPSDLELWDRLAVLANRTGRAQRFVEAIAEAVPPTGDTGLPANVEMDLSERAATLYDEMLGEQVRAQPYLERILARDPGNERAFVRLKQILTTLERWDVLEALYERAIGAAPDPSRRADLLTEVALVAEEITGDRPKAIGFYERILEIEPDHEQAARALDALYAQEGRWDRLAELLTARLKNASIDEGLALKLRLGTLWFSRLSDPEKALGYLEQVLESDATNADARALVERCLENPDLRARAAGVLEAVYVALDAPRDLVRILEIRLESSSVAPDEAKDLLRRVAELRDERLKEGAFGAYARLAPLAPEDAHARSRLLDLARAAGRQDEAARVLEQSAERAEAPQPRAEILSEVARLYEQDLGDPSRAEGIYRLVLEIDPDDTELALPAARSLERLTAAAGKAAELAQILKIEVRLEQDGARRRELYGRLGDLCENALDDPRGAIDAWKARLEDDPLDEAALGALDRLYERTGDHRALVDVLRARERHTGDPEARRRFLERIAQTLADKLSDVTEAILAYRVLVDEYGPHRSSLSALETLYEVADRWPDLAETLEASLSLAETDAERLSLLARLGTVRQTRLDDVPGAIEAYRQGLVVDTSHAPSRAALEALLVDTDARHEAAGILRPLYEADGTMEQLLRVLEIEVEYEGSPAAKLDLYAQCVKVAEEQLRDPARAFAYSARALREAVSEPSFTAWLERTERLAAATGKWEEHVDLLKSIAPDILDGDQQLEVTLRVADLSRTRLGDAQAARSYYVKALDLRGDERRALSALESLYEENADSTALHDILKRRAETAGNDEEKKAVLFKLARIEADTLGDARAAIETYEAIGDLGYDPRAFVALEGLYTQTSRWEDIIQLYEARLGAETDDERKAELHHKLGTVFQSRMNDLDRAFDEYEAALASEAQHAATVASLESLLENREVAGKAAAMLEPVYLGRLDWRKVLHALEVRLDVSQDPDERRTLLKRLAKLHEEQEENYRAALETTAKLLTEDVTDEPTWAELERLARVANAELRLAEIYASELEKVSADEPATARLAKRTGELFEAQARTAGGGDAGQPLVERALHFYSRSYAFAPDEDRASFEAIDRLLRESRRPADRVLLYREALEYKDDPKERIRVLHVVAELQENDLGDQDGAIETFRQALEIDDADARSLESLARLYARRERWSDLADLLRRRAEQSALPEDEAKYRFELGKLMVEKLGDNAGALDELQAVVEAAPDSVAANDTVRLLESLLADSALKGRVVEILRPIYERKDDWRHLIAVNDERLGIALGNGEKVTILRETARLWEDRGKDLGKAFDAAQEAFVLDPDDGESRSELDRLAELTKRWDDLAAAYEAAIWKTEDVGKKELLGALARLHDKKRDDPRKALDAYERLFRLDESDPDPLEQMDQLATLLSDWSVLVHVLAKRAELTGDDEERASLWRRIGEARRDMLDDAGGAIEAYERALELESESAFTMDNLIALYEQKNDAARLVDLYRRRVELCGEDDEGLKYQLLLDAAGRYEHGLNDRREAITLLGEALTVKPGEMDVVRRLDQLFTAERMWPELLENLRTQSGAAAAGGDAAALRTLEKRIGSLLAHELDDPTQALDAYGGVLAAGYDEDAARAIREIGDAHDELRVQAADRLEPVLRAAGKHADVIGVLEMRLRALADPTDRARALRDVAEVAERSLGDASAAEAALLRALAETPDDPGLHLEIERLAGQIGKDGWERYADAITERAGAIFDAQVTTDLYVRLGRIAEDKLGDDARAARAYVSAAEQAGDNGEILGSLDRLYGRLGETHKLGEILERRIGLEADAAAQADLYHRLASLHIKEFGEKGQGLATLRLAVERVPDHAASRAAIEELLEEGALFDEAFDALEGVYRSLGRSDDLARIYEKKVARAQGTRDRSRARLDLARVLEEQAHDPARAQRVVEQALGEDPADADVLSELERLAGVTTDWRSAADGLGAALAAARDLAPGTLVDLAVRLATWRRDKLDDRAGAEDAFRRALAADPENLEVLRAIEDLRRAPGRERDLVETLRARTKVETDPSTKRDLWREAFGIAEGQLGDAALAEACLRELLAEDEADLWALEELTRLREAAGDTPEAIRLLQKRAELEADGGKIAELKHRAASVMAEKAGDRAGAIALYEELFEADPNDKVASSRLRALYGEEGKNEELARLLEALIDGAEGPEARASLRLELAKLQRQLDQPRRAVDTLRAVLDEDPSHTEAVVALSEIYESTGQDEELAELLNAQIEGARGRGDGDTELRLQVRLGEVFESRLRDTTRALATYEAVLERQPDHRGALEAVARLAEGKGDWARAAGALDKLAAMATSADEIDFALRLADARGKEHDDAGIEAAYRRALALDPGNEIAGEGLRALYERTKDWPKLADLLVLFADRVAAEHPADAQPPEAPPAPEPGARTSIPARGAAAAAAAAASMPPPVSGARAEIVKLLRRAAEIHASERKAATDAVPLLERASALVPHDRELLLLLVDAYTGAGRERDAARVLERVIASFGTKRTKELSVYHHRLGKALAQLGDKDVALTQLDMAFKIDPGSVGVLRDLGVLALETNDLDRAQKTFRALLLQRLDASTGISKGEVFYYLGEISAKQGDKAKAVQMLERAIENEPSLDRAKAKLQELKG